MPFPVFLAALAIIFDGLDNQLLGFAIPAILRDWQVSRAAFGPVIASGLAGMCTGSLLAGPIGDRTGRRLAIIGSVFVFAASTTAMGGASSVTMLTILRFLTGAGIGGAIPNATALAAEFAPLKRRAMAVTITLVCVPLGGMLGGVIAAWVLPAYGWRALFATGGIAPGLLCVVLWFLLPESPQFLAEKRDQPLRAVFAPALLRDTLSLWLAFFCCLLSIYMIFSWLPTLLSSEGMSLAAASSGLAMYNLGGVAGALICGGLVMRFGSRVPLLVGSFCAAVSLLALRGIPVKPSTMLFAGLAVNGFFSNAVQVALFALAAHVYPTGIRSSGVAFAVTIGRIGPILSAFAGATLIGAGRASFLTFLAIAMSGTFVGLALMRRHIPARFH